MKKADLIIVAVVLAVAGVLCFYLYFVNGDSGKFVQVEVDGKVVDTLKLDEDFEKQYDFDGDTNTLVIKDGKAKVTKANCPDGICVNHKAVNRSGESIICLPHKFVVTVTDEKSSDDEIDAVA
ncbi:NusG domain II-containing protein [Eubacterium coprostanoligenes]|uniref:NusG domain II-containing protein n=1 Tax=Eubacterium coprostanoligenes TaxID=290054 RepID=UPI002A7ECA63|nr:NusG domain II-containing protein [Eubacterium coprostanoligenes]MDY4699448.1 NusG domain II-containing protein [Eubacterium coprostanoligenes]